MEKMELFKSTDGTFHATEASAKEADSSHGIMKMLDQMLNSIESDIGPWEIFPMFIINPLSTAVLAKMVKDHVNTFGEYD